MAAFARVHPRVRLGQMCTCMGYRNPAYLAKVAATVDIVSGGRVEMGIGGGWYEHEWRAYGYGFPRAGERLGMLDEGVEIMRQAWTTGARRLDGKHYQVDGAICRPLPLQDGRHPVVDRRRRREGDAARSPRSTRSTRTSTARPRGSRTSPRCCAGTAATSAPTSTRSCARRTTTSSIGATEADVEDRLQQLKARMTPLVGADRAEGRWAGTAGCRPAARRSRSWRTCAAQGRGNDYGINYFPEAAYDRSGIELFEREVVPALA